MSTLVPESSKKRKKAVYKDADEGTPAKRFKPSSAADDIPDLNAYEALDEAIATDPPSNKEKIPKKKKQIARQKKKVEVEIAKSNHSPLLLVSIV